jgi:transcriptional regulator GlxA family with amidase domain
MTDIPQMSPEVQARLAIEARRQLEDWAFKLGEERRQLDGQLSANTNQIMTLLPQAIEAGIPLDQLAQMVGVSRQSLHRWRNESGYPASPVEL